MDASTVDLLTNRFLGPAVIGCLLSFASCGVVLALVFQYFSLFGNKDRLPFRCLVGVLGVIVSVDTACNGSWLYKWTIQALVDPNIYSRMPWEISAFTVTSSLCILIVQCFYIWRLHHVSMGHAWPLVLFLSLAALATVACAIRMFAFCATTQLLALYSDSSLQAWLWAWYSLAIVNDFVITASLWYYVVHKPQKNHTGKTTITRSPLMRIIHRSYQTNAISLALQVLILILLGSARDAFRYGIAAFSVGKCYAGCLIACLNSRRSSGRFDELDSPISPSPVAIVPSLARKFTSNRRTSRSRNGNVGDRPNTSTQSVQVTVDHSIAVEVDPNPVWAPSDEGVNERYAVMFDGRERKDVEKGMSSTGDGTEVEEVELDRYA